MIAVAVKLGYLVGASGFSSLGVLGFTHEDAASIIVALIGAGGLVMAGRHGGRLKRVEEAVHATKKEARAAVDELASLGNGDGDAK